MALNHLATEKYNFRNYLLAELPDTRQEDLIFWKKTIPMPVDLVYEIFEKRGILLKKYLEHIGAAALFAYALQKEGRDWKTELGEQPPRGNHGEPRNLEGCFGK